AAGDLVDVANAGNGRFGGLRAGVAYDGGRIAGDDFVSAGNPGGKSDDEDDARQCRRKPRGPKNVRKIESPTLPEVRLVRGFERFLKPHSRSRQQVRAG